MANSEKPQILLARDYFDAIDSGDKTQTVRKGRRDYPLGAAELVSTPDDSGEPEIVRDINIIGLTITQLGRLGTEAAQSDGFDDVTALETAMRRHYPDITAESEVTVVHFESEV